MSELDEEDWNQTQETLDDDDYDLVQALRLRLRRQSVKQFWLLSGCDTGSEAAAAAAASM